jgi:hypothetical protein
VCENPVVAIYMTSVLELERESFFRVRDGVQQNERNAQWPISYVFFILTRRLDIRQTMRETRFHSSRDMLTDKAFQLPQGPLGFKPGELVGCVSGELGLHSYLEKSGHEFIVTSDKDGARDLSASFPMRMWSFPSHSGPPICRRDGYSRRRSLSSR